MEHPPRSIIVTGSGSGIGAAIVDALAGPTARIVVHALSNRTGCERISAAAEKAGAKTSVFMGDLSEQSVAHGIVDHAVELFGGVDVLVANAGFPIPKEFGEADEDDLNKCHRAMTGGFFNMANRAMPHLKQSSHGRVVAISTLNAHVFRTQYPVYPASAAAKAALEALIHALAFKLAPHQVTVNAVAPGLIVKDADTVPIYSAEERAGLLAQVPLGRMGRPSEVAALVAFLCSVDAAYITGQTMHINGGIV